MLPVSSQAAQTLSFVKGHGTENDFVLIPDHDGSLRLEDSLVRRLADRRAGLGADGVIRVVRTAAADEPQVRALAAEAEWFMDYRNADGSIAEMCGNGTRVIAAYLRREHLVSSPEFALATRAGVKRIRAVDDAGEGQDGGYVPGERYAVDMGTWRVVAPGVLAERGHDALVALAGLDPLPGLSIDMGNPHTVVALPEEADLMALDLQVAPLVNPRPPHGTNVEFAQLLGPGHLQMRVYERGVGETRSCGTGACAAALAVMLWSGAPRDNDAWRVDLPGGTVQVTALPGGSVELAGPARLVADGVYHLT